MITNFTPRAQQVLALARKEADRLDHNYIGSEHLLLGLIEFGKGVAVNVLQKMGLNLVTVRLEVEKQAGKGSEPKVIGNIPYTPRSKKVLELAQKEAAALNHTYVGTEHILLGILREGNGTAARVLTSLGINLEETRREILCELDPNFNAQDLGKSPTPSHNERNPMSSPRETPLTAFKPEPLDTSKRYDVYCNERNQDILVYRNVMFKGIRQLCQTGQYDFMAHFIELEQADGKTVFVARMTVIKFCEHGITPQSENVSTNKPGQ
jgi:ATP-dependent Clp protease ATP-binding subunit ClpA